MTLLACTLWASSAAAEPHLSLTWRAPTGCPTESDVLQRARRMLRGSNANVSVDATARVTRQGDLYLVRLTTHGDTGEGQRSLTAESCDAAASATALMLALAVDPNAQLSEPGEAPGGQPGGEDSANPRGNTSHTPRLTPKSESRLRPVAGNSTANREASGGSSVAGRVSVGGEVSWGVLPKATLAPSIGAGFGVGRLWLDLQGAYFPGSTQTLLDDRRGGDFSRWALSLRAFYGLGPERLRLGPAAHLIATRIQGEGRDVSAPRRTSAWLGALAFGPRLEWRPGALGFALGGESAFPFTRPSFALDELGTVHSPARVAFAGHLEAFLVF